MRFYCGALTTRTFAKALERDPYGTRILKITFRIGISNLHSVVEETASQTKGEKNYFESICYVKHAKNFTYFNLFDFHDSPMRSLLFFSASPVRARFDSVTRPPSHGWKTRR